VRRQGAKVTEPIISEELRNFLLEKEFLYIATSWPDARPNVAPKFLIRVDQDFIYLADFVIGRTWENLKLNPQVSLSIINIESLTGYQLNGAAEILESGDEFEGLMKDLHKREVRFSAERIIEGMQKDRKHQVFEAAFPKRLLVLKVAVKEIVDIAPTGKLKRSQK
jgi:predicted pyridoxine 5'-phosphate oxidase superfamily flavin-nucleotide-binding protein